MPGHSKTKAGYLARRNAGRASDDPYGAILRTIDRLEDDEERLTRAIRELVRKANVDPGRSGLAADDTAWAYAIPNLRHAREQVVEIRKAIIEATSKAIRLHQREREAQLKEQIGGMWLAAMTPVFDQLDLTPIQRNMVPQLVEQSIRRLENTQ